MGRMNVSPTNSLNTAILNTVGSITPSMTAKEDSADSSKERAIEVGKEVIDKKWQWHLSSAYYTTQKSTFDTLMEIEPSVEEGTKETSNVSDLYIKALNFHLEKYKNELLAPELYLEPEPDFDNETVTKKSSVPPHAISIYLETDNRNYTRNFLSMTV